MYLGTFILSIIVSAAVLLYIKEIYTEWTFLGVYCCDAVKNLDKISQYYHISTPIVLRIKASDDTTRQPHILHTKMVFKILWPNYKDK